MKAINELNRHLAAIAPAIEQAVIRVIASGTFVLGPEVNAFEREFAAYVGSAYCVSLANGTDALELALRALEIGPNHTVLTVANAGMYSTAAILATGATPVYADVQSDTLLIDVADAARLVGELKIDAIVITHLYGLMVDIVPFVQLAKSKNIPVIEDCAQAHGATIDHKKAGSFGDIGCFSFYPTKNLGAIGDGGAITTSRKDLADRVRQLRQYGWGEKYHAIFAGGSNSRLDEIQAAVLRIKLPMLDQWNARRRDIAARYSEGISNTKIITQKIHGKEYVAHLYVIRATGRNCLRSHLAAVGISSDVHYPVPDYAQLAYRHLHAGKRLTVTERMCAEVLSLPCYPELTDEEIDFIIARINSW
jgi:aminotransferase EvaB